MMNKKGGVMLKILVGVFIFIVGVLFIQHFTTNIDETRTLLNCDNATALTSGGKLTCLMVGGTIPYFIWTFVSIAFAFIGDWLL